MESESTMPLATEIGVKRRWDRKRGGKDEQEREASRAIAPNIDYLNHT
jgi:hypothetical protein